MMMWAQVATVRGFPVFKVTGTRIFTNGNKSIRDDNRCSHDPLGREYRTYLNKSHVTPMQ